MIRSCPPRALNPCESVRDHRVHDKHAALKAAGRNVIASAPGEARISTPPCQHQAAAIHAIEAGPRTKYTAVGRASSELEAAIAAKFSSARTASPNKPNQTPRSAPAAKPGACTIALEWPTHQSGPDESFIPAPLVG